MNEFTKVIEQHLRDFAAEDAHFAEKFNAKMACDKNSIIQCCSYIISEVRKSGRQAFHDDEIYAMAIHFFDEGMSCTEKAPSCKIVTPSKSKPKAMSPKRQVQQDDVQLSLF